MANSMQKTVLIMAGGQGERFWPQSRKDLPKQFLPLTCNDRTMIQLTVDRMQSIVNPKNIFIVTNEVYKELIKLQVPTVPDENILYEPIGKNTAPSIGLGAVHIAKKYGDAVMMVLPCDHLIRSEKIFRSAMKEVCNVAEKTEALITIGITPDHPETGYGYINFAADSFDGKSYKVKQFVEKPDLETAKKYIASDEYMWNSGMFAWKVSVILDSMKKFLPDNYKHLVRIQNSIGTAKEAAVLKKEFSAMDSESIDYGILERSENIRIVPGAFGWDDVGSWLSVGRLRECDENGNVISGDVIEIGSNDCIIRADKKLIAAVGLKNLVIVDSGDAILICSKDSTAEIKNVLKILKENNRTDLL
jgi:mannose-1-phosphate guanylyltransferase